MPDNGSDEHLPDIDAGLAELSQETTAADLLREKGQRKKLKVIKSSQLKAQIQDWIRAAVEEQVADHAESLSHEEREAIIAQTEERVQEAMQRSQEAEAKRLAAEQDRQQLEERVNSLAEEHNANAELTRSIQELQERLQKAELVAEESQQDVLAMETDLENIQKIHQATRAEKERLEETIRNHMLHTTDLVGQVLGIDSQYYGDRHQQEHPVPEDAEGQEAFYHDFAVGAKVIETLAGDLGKLREISSQQAEAAEAEPQLLEQDLELLAQLKSGSLDAVELAAPVENLVEAIGGAREEVMGLQQAASSEGDQPAPITALPEADGDPAEVLQGASHVLRELGAALAAERAKVAALSEQGGERDKANQALRDNMIRTSELVQGVLQLDGEYYGGRHQEENPVGEDVEGEDAFYHDFDVGAKIIETLSGDLARLKELTKDQDKYSGLLDSDLELLEQLKEGSLKAVDVAAPVENLIEALDGARSEATALNTEADEALNLPVGGSGQAISALPDGEGEPSEVLAGATQVARELATALAAERKRLKALRALADEADAARQGGETELESLRALADGLVQALKEQADDFGVDAPEALMAADAPAEQRLEGAKTVLDALHDRLEQEAATVDELSSTLESLLGEEVEAATEAEQDAVDQAGQQRAILGDLKTKVDQLGDAYQRLRKSYVASRVRERALADQLQALARDLDPEFADDEAEEVGIELGKVEQALAEDQRDEAKPTVDDAERAEQLGSAIDGLIASMRRRASQGGGRGAAPSEAVEALSREILEAAKADDDVAGHEVTTDLAQSLDDEDKGAAGVLEAAGRVIGVLSARRMVLSEDLAAALHEKERHAGRIAELEARVEELKTELDTSKEGYESVFKESQAKVEELEATLATQREELEEAKEGMLSGKEVIAHLSDKDKRQSAEVETLKAEHAKLQEDVAARAVRLAKAEAANRRLSETLSEMSASMLQEEVGGLKSGDLEEARVELEVALSELPAEEGAADIPVREDLADDLAEAGTTLLDRIRAREAGLVSRVTQLEGELDGLQSAKTAAETASQEARSQAAERGDEVEKLQARIGAFQQDLDEVNATLAAKSKDLTQARDDLAETRAELESAKRHGEELEETATASKARVEELESELATLKQGQEAALGEAQSKATELEEALATARSELEEAKEGMLSGKEVIAHLSDKDKRQVAELDRLKAEQTHLIGEVQAKDARLNRAEAANRRLSEALSEISAGMLEEDVEDPERGELEAARVDLETALSELPAEEGGEDVPVRADLADDIAAAGTGLLERIRAREAALAASVGRLQQEVAGLEAAKAEAESAGESARSEAESAAASVEKLEARIGAFQQELDEANETLATKGKDLSQAREELATTKAELESARRKSAEQEETIAALQADTTAADQVRAELDEVQQQLQKAREDERALAGQLNELAGWSGEVASEFDLMAKRESQRYTRSRSKVEEAVTSEEEEGLDSLGERSKELAEQVQGQGALILEKMREQREQLARLYEDNDQMRTRLSSLEAGAAQRDHQLQQAQTDLDEARSGLEAAEAEASRQKELLRQAKAALEEYKAREGEHAGGVDGKLSQLREELDQEREAREAADQRLAETRDELEATVAGLRARGEELDQRIQERDEEISRLQDQLDEELGQRVESAEGQARLRALESELESERELRAKLEAQLEEFRGGIGEEMSKAQKGRSELMDKLRRLEGELGEERGRAEALKSSKENLRKDMNEHIDRLKGQLQAERDAKEQFEESERQLREELAGLRARIRTLTSDDE